MNLIESLIFAQNLLRSSEIAHLKGGERLLFVKNLLIEKGCQYEYPVIECFFSDGSLALTDKDRNPALTLRIE